MSIRIPVKVEPEVQSAFQDIDVALNEIAVLKQQIEDLRKTVIETEKSVGDLHAAADVKPVYVTQPDTVVEGDLKVTGDI